MRTIVLVNAKGGTGKSTLAASLAVAAAATGEKVIALDLDPQGSLASWGGTRTANDVAVDRIDGERLPRLPQILAGLDRRGFTSRSSIRRGSTARAPTSRCAALISALCQPDRRGSIWRRPYRPSSRYCVSG